MGWPWPSEIASVNAVVFCVQCARISHSEVTSVWLGRIAKLGMGKPHADALVFCRHDDSNLVPSSVTRDWHRAVRGRWTFHALRHTHASALIADGLDPVTIAARLGHSSPTITLQVYAHQFRKRKTDTTAADSIEKLLGANRVPKPGNGY